MTSTETARARSLRQRETKAEHTLWLRLRDRRLGGHKFVRQYPIGPFFVDFACREERLIVELDGSQHADDPRDASRELFLNRQNSPCSGSGTRRFSQAWMASAKPSWPRSRVFSTRSIGIAAPHPPFRASSPRQRGEGNLPVKG